MRRQIIITIATVAVVAAACGGDATTDTTVAATSTTGSVAATSTTTGDTATTAAAATTTSAATTTTEEATTTTAAPPSPGDAQAVVDAKAAAFAAAAPPSWMVEEQENESFDEDDFGYEPCLGLDDFNLDELEAATIAVKEVRATAPAGPIPFGSTSAIIEARVLESDAVAAEVFGVIERIYGSDEGRQCMSQIVTEAITEDTGGLELTVSVEALEVEGADVAARTLMEANIEGFDFVMTIDLVAHRDGACTVVGTFISFGEEFPADVADELFSAAAGA